MFNQRNNGPFGGQRNNNKFGNYHYQTLAYGSPTTSAQASGLVSKVMALLATSFLVATVGAFVGLSLGLFSYIFVIIAGFVVLLLLYAMINKQGINLFLLFLFTFIEGLGLGPLVNVYLGSGNGSILGQAFLITAVTAIGLAVYSWTTKRSFARIGDYLFVGLILLLVTSLIGLIFQSPIFSLIIAFFGVAIFCGYILYYVQRAKTMADTLPNAIGLTVSLFLALMNLFLFILEILSIFQGGGRGRR